MSVNGRPSPSDVATAEALGRWRGGRAKVWDYSPTLATLTVRVESRDRPGNLHIVCGGCEHLHGPFRWEDCAFEVVPDDHSADGPEQVLRDAAAGFEVRCRVVGVQENVEPVYQPAALTPSA